MSNNTGTSSNKDITYYKELISALNDGELNSDELSEVLLAMETHPSLREFWLDLQTQSAVLKGENSELADMNAQRSKSLVFASKVSLQLKEQDLHLVNGVTDAVAIKQTGSTNNVTSITSLSSKAKTAQVTEGSAIGSSSSSSYAGIKNFAIAASVMFVVTFAWFGTQGQIGGQSDFGQTQFAQTLSSLFGNDQPSENLNEGQELALESAADRILPQGSVLVSTGQIGNSAYQQTAPDQTQGTVNSNLHLSNSRIKDYLRLHAEHASLNTNHGIMPFARMTKVPADNQF